MDNFIQKNNIFEYYEYIALYKAYRQVQMKLEKQKQLTIVDIRHLIQINRRLDKTYRQLLDSKYKEGTVSEN